MNIFWSWWNVEKMHQYFNIQNNWIYNVCGPLAYTGYVDKMYQYFNIQNNWIYNVCGPLAYTGYVDKMHQYFNNENNWIYVDPELLHECG